MKIDIWEKQKLIEISWKPQWKGQWSEKKCKIIKFTKIDFREEKRVLLVVISFCSKLTSARQQTQVYACVRTRVFVYFVDEIGTAARIKKCLVVFFLVIVGVRLFTFSGFVNDWLTKLFFRRQTLSLGSLSSLKRVSICIKFTSMYVTFWPIVFLLSFFLRFNLLCASMSKPIPISIHGVAHRFVRMGLCIFVYFSLSGPITTAP